jgi:hypothetical protein
MLVLPKAAEPLIRAFAPAFTGPTYQRIVLLLIGAIVTGGRRTVSRILWPVRSLVRGHPSSYHRVFSQARWSLWPLAKVLVLAVVALVPPDEPILIAGDDTVAEHRGDRVYGKGCYRDAVRSGRHWTVRKWGHRWVILAILVKLPFASRRWALPALCALYRPPAMSKRERRRHKVPSQLARSLLAALMHWLPQRRFIFLGDSQFSSQELADFAHQHRDRLTLVGRIRSDACLYAPLPKSWRKRHRLGRPRRKGRRLATPQQHVEHARQRTLNVRWYGNARRRVNVVSGKGIWYRAGYLAPIRWVYVHDPISDRRDYFYTTDPRLCPRRIIELYAARWSIEVTFQELKQQLGWASTRQRSRRSVLRSAPCLMGCFSVVSLIYTRHTHGGKTATARQTLCHHRAEPTFTDALLTTRRLLWDQTILSQSIGDDLVAKCPHKFKDFLLWQLAEAA